jgi:hypothetical protein
MAKTDERAATMSANAITKDMLVDTLGLGFALWLAGYLASFVLYFALPKSILGWVLFAFFTPVTILVAYFRFRKRGLPLVHFFKVAAAWTVIAIVFDYLFIFLLLNAHDYYALDVLLYYATTFAIPVTIGMTYSKKS